MFDISVIIPAYNESENLNFLIPELLRFLEKSPLQFEVIIVDDGSTDFTVKGQSDWKQSQHIRCIRHPERMGKSKAWLTGFRAANGRVYATLDADMQDNPREILTLYRKYSEGYDIVSAKRRRRRDPFFRKSLPSIFANSCIKVLTGVPVSDLGSGLKVFNPDLITHISTEDGFHRVLPLLAYNGGYSVAEIPVEHRARQCGASKYGQKRMLEFLKSVPSIMNERSYLLALSLCTILAIFLRVIHLTSTSLWHDEALSIYYASKPFPTIASALAQHSVHPPLYFWILHFWIKLIGGSDISIRLFSVLLGGISIPCFAALARNIAGRKVALFSSILLTLSTFHIHYSQEVRPYALMGVLILLSHYFYRKVQRQKPHSYMWYLISSSLLLYSHVFGTFVIITQNVDYLVRKFTCRKDSISLRRWAALQLLLFLSFTPWIKSFISQASATIRYAWIPAPDIKSLYIIFREFSSGSKYLFALAIIVTGLSFYMHKLSIKRESRALVLWIALPIIIAYAVSYVYRPVVWARYFFQSYFNYILLLALSTISLPKRFLIRFCATTSVLFLMGHALVSYYQNEHREQWKTAFASLSQVIPQSERILILSKRNDHAVLAKRYLQDNITPINEDTIQQCKENCPLAIWYVTTGYTFRHDPIHKIANEAGYTQTQTSYDTAFYGLKVARYSRKKG